MTQFVERRPDSEPPARVLRVIACYKFTKAVLLTATGLGALKLLDPRTLPVLEGWATALAARRARRALVHGISWLSGLHARRLDALAVGAFLFAALFLAEGVGLWLGKRWALYLTVIATTLFVPFEALQLVRGASLTRAVVLLLNVALVAFLVSHLPSHSTRRAAETESRD